MIDLEYRLLLFMKDFTGRGADALYWFHEGQIQETDAASVVEYPGIVVCHDFWLIRDALFDCTGTLPGTIIDVDEFRISISGISIRSGRDALPCSRLLFLRISEIQLRR